MASALRLLVLARLPRAIRPTRLLPRHAMTIRIGASAPFLLLAAATALRDAPAADGPGALALALCGMTALRAV